MLKKEHIVFGATCGAAIGTLLLRKEIIPIDRFEFTCMAMVGSILPDIDEKAPFKYIFSHRVETHDVLTWGLIAAFVCTHTTSSLILGLMLGILSHLWLDGFNKMGVPYGVLFFLKKDKEYSEAVIAYSKAMASKEAYTGDRNILKRKKFTEGWIHLLPKKLSVASNGRGPAVFVTLLNCVMVIAICERLVPGLFLLYNTGIDKQWLMDSWRDILELIDYMKGGK
jgi:hypothetical protein